MIIQLFREKNNYIMHAVVCECILLLINALFHFVTVMPDSDYYHSPYCNNKSLINIPRIFHFTPSEYCGDMIFSGHLQHLILSLIVIYWLFFGCRCCEHERETEELKQLEEEELGQRDSDRIVIYKIIYIFSSILLILIEYLFLIVTRFHYSIDVSIALVLVPTIMTHQSVHIFILWLEHFFSFKKYDYKFQYVFTY